MKVSDFVADFIASVSPHVFGVCGGGAMYLNDSIAHHPGIKWVATHHEQAAAFAAEAYARVSNRPGVVHVTAGPGVTNAMTGVACAYADSLPMIVIAGQVDSATTRTSTRQLGISEVDGVALMIPITKYAVSVIHAEMIAYHLQKALYEAMHGRKGPVYVEIPLNIQNAEVDPDKIRGFAPLTVHTPQARAHDLDVCMAMLKAAKRPVLLLGNGVRLAGAKEELDHFLRSGAKIPVLCSWSGADLVPSMHSRYVGRPGLIGDRAGNFAIQAADLVIAVGTRLSIPQIGHNWKDFARNAKIVMVDVDAAEMKKKTLRVDLPIVADAFGFLHQLTMRTITDRSNPDWDKWGECCRDWRDAYPVIDPDFKDGTDGVHSYYFLEELAKQIDDDAIIVTDVGTSFVGTMQAMPMSGRQRMFHSPGIAPMGYGLPAAIGAAFAAPGRQIICLTGDGGTMFNLQEMQTLLHHNLPITVFLYANRGYKTMQTTQGNHFQREAVASPDSDVSWPVFGALAQAFGIPRMFCCDNASVPRVVRDAVAKREGPLWVDLSISPSQIIAPLIKTKVESGQFVPVPFEDMWPYLPRDEFEETTTISG